MSDEKLKLIEQLELTLGESSFKALRVAGGLYVDKTEQIYNCMKRIKYLFLARPRRFGKSLLCSTIEELFSGNRELFKGLWIDGSDWSWEQYPVIKLDMLNVTGGVVTRDSVNRELLRTLNHIAKKYDVIVPDVDEAWVLLKELIDALFAKFNKPAVVIIDEYDKPLLEVIDDKEAFNAIQALLKAFYEQLKSKSALLRLVFITGVFKFSKAGMFSGANNFTDLTFNPKAGTIVGYTQQELERYFSSGIEVLAGKTGENAKSMKMVLKERYNGYQFGYDVDSGKLSEGVYNPFGINHVFAANAMLDEWFASGNPSILLKKLHAENCRTLLDQDLAIDATDLASPSVLEQFNTLPLLYFGGYLTIESFSPSTKKLSLFWPNAEVSSAFTKQLLKELMPENSTMIKDVAIEICNNLRMQKFDRLKELFNQILACIGYKMILALERQYQLIFFMLLSAGGLKTRVEEVTQDGRIDIVVELHKLIYILELKIGDSAENAIQQIKDKDYARKYRKPGDMIWAIGIGVAGKSKDEDKPKNAVNDLVVEAL